MKTGRRKGSRTKGYFFRQGRGWTGIKGGKMILLRDDDGRPLRRQNEAQVTVVLAFLRFKREQEEVGKARDQVTVAEVCELYLKQVEVGGRESTLTTRRAALFDFCVGLPFRFRDRLLTGDKISAHEIKRSRIHPGYGHMRVCDLRPVHLTEWLQAHPGWKSSARIRISGVMAALNYAAGSNMRLIPANPLKGFKRPPWNARSTYITPEQEEAFKRHGSPQFNDAFAVLLRTGMRYGIEFCAIRPRHIKVEPKGLLIQFSPNESKNHKLRLIHVQKKEPVAAEVIELFRKYLEAYRGEGCIFHDHRGRPWTKVRFAYAFDRVRAKVREGGIPLDRDCCPYSLRHTYAKRTLQGYWTGKATNIETLAMCMGNSPKTCSDHYATWVDSYTEPIWAAC